MALTRARAYQILDSDIKQSVRAATTASVTLSGGAPSTVDTTVSLSVGDRILVKDQSPGSGNGIYVVTTVGTGSNGTWSRASDFDTTAKVTSGLQIYVEEGTLNGDKVFGLTTNNPITLGTTALTFSVLSSAGTASAGGADTNIQYNSGGTFAGSASLTFDGSNVDVAGYLDAGNLRIGAGGNTIQSNNSNGNINLTPNGTGVILANANITAPVFISNVGTGTAPFTVTSTTQVANLNVAAASIAGTVTTAAQPNITSVGNLTIANIDNIQIDGNTISSTNTNGNINLTPNGTGEVVAASLTVSDLTSGRLALVGTSGALTDTTAFTWSGSDITITGNVSGGNINTSGKVVASTLTSNIAPGTAPFTVTSTTQVANLNVATAGTATTAGTVTTAAQPNITSVGTLTSLTASGAITSNFSFALNYASADTFGSGLSVYKIGTTGNSSGSVTTNTELGYHNFYGWDGTSYGRGAYAIARTTEAWSATARGTSYAIATTANGTTTNAVRLTIGQDGNVSIVGNVSYGGQLTSNIATGTAPFVVTSTTQVANLNVAVAGSATTAGTVTTAAQPNITSVGTLTSLGVNGTITGTRLISNIATGTAPFTVTSTTQVANLNVATAGSATTAGTVTTAAQPNITSVGTLTSLTVSGTTNLGAVGNITITGGTNGYVLSTNGSGVLSWVAQSGGGGASVTTDVSAPGSPSDGNLWFDEDDGSIYIYYADGTSSQWVELGATTGIGAAPGSNTQVVFNDNGVLGASSSLTFASANLNLTGNLIATGQLRSTITTGTAPLVVSSTTQVANLNVATAGTAGTVTTAAQPNITSLGTLTALTTSGQLTSTLAAGTAPFVVTSTTRVNNLNVALSGTVTTAAQPNITSVGTLTSLTTSGQITSTLAAGTAPLVVTSTTQVANLNVATAGTAGTVTTAAQPNITSVGNLTIANVDNIRLDGNTISTTNTNGNLSLTPNGTGTVIVGNATVNTTISTSGITFNTSTTAHKVSKTGQALVMSMVFGY